MLRYWRNGNWYYILGLLATIGIVVVVLWPPWRGSAPTLTYLPAAKDVKEMGAFYSPGGHKDVEFRVPAAHFAELLESLQPCSPDRHPAFWLVLGNLDIVCHDGRRFDVGLYRTQNEVGAFSIASLPENPNENRGVYFRGSTDKTIEEALQRALADTPEADKKHIGN